MSESNPTKSVPPFYTRYGFSRTGQPDAPLQVDPYPEICAGGALRATVVASAIDIVGGLFTREIAGADATFTSDLSLRIPAPGMPIKVILDFMSLKNYLNAFSQTVSPMQKGLL